MNNYYKYKYLKYKNRYIMLKKGYGYTFNYYTKNRNECILDRKLYECPIFATHNTFIWRKSNSLDGIFTEEALDDVLLLNYIDYILHLTLKFPVCIEIDSKIISLSPSCKLGHGITSSYKFNNIGDLTMYIINKYNEYNEYNKYTKKLYPLIIHFDTSNKCLSKLSNYFRNNYKEYSKCYLKDCMSKVIFRHKSSYKFNNYITKTKSVGINLNLINKINKSTCILDIYKKLKIVGDRNLLYKLYPTTYKQIDISDNLIKLIIKLFNYDYIEIYNCKYNLPTLISFNLYNLYYKKSNLLLNELICKFTNFYKLNITK